MIKKQFALILILWFSGSFTSTCSAQNIQDLNVYDWEEVQSANPDTVYAITFEKNKLTELPSGLEKFKHLKYLNLAKNKLTDLPSFLKDFDSLEWLNLTKNKLSNFPIEICQLPKLKVLMIGSNDIASLPDCIEYATNLEYLDVYDNPLAYIPESMMRLKKLRKIDFTGIRFNKEFQKKWTEQLPNAELVFDSPCDCMD